MKEILLFLVLAAASTAASPVRLIVDTDAGFDVDDVGALGVANALADAGECEIIAVGHTNGFIKGIGAVSTLMHFHQRDDVPLGSYKGEWARNPTAGTGTADKYISDLIENYPSPIKNSTQVPEAVKVYRKALAASPDHSVHIASIGITTNMRDLVLSKPDEYSSLTGVELIAKKVSLVVWMDMMYNFGCAQAATDDWLGPSAGCHGSAQAAVMNWPGSVQQIFSSVGGDILHGGWLDGCGLDGNPYRQAFDDWGVGGTGRSSWDPIAVMIAVRGASGVHAVQIDEGGYMEVAVSGKETWHQSVGHNQSRISFQNGTVRSVVSFELNQLLCKPTGPWSNTTWVKASGENCYGSRGNVAAHGATDLESPPSASAGVMSIDKCHQLCIGTAGCTAVSTIPTSNGGGTISCYRKSDVVLKMCDAGTAYTTWMRRDWYAAQGYNCYPGHGADNVDVDDGVITTVAECQARCGQTAGCTGAVWSGKDHSGEGACYLKKNIDLTKCDRGTTFNTLLSSLN